MSKEIIKENVDSAFFAPTEKKYCVQFRENRSFELHVGRKYFYIEPFGLAELTESEINHPDFKQQAGYFNIKEI
jgi:hypothetical protein